MKAMLAGLLTVAIATTAADAASTVSYRNPDTSPTGEIPTTIKRKFVPMKRVLPKAPTLPDLTAEVSPSARANGSHGISYTSTRVQLGTSSYSSSIGANYIATTYPYRAIGRIVFTAPEGDQICSGTLIRRGIVLTAAHCIQEFGAGSTRYTNWTFTPANWSVAGATTQQAAPYGSWAWSRVEVPATYANGTDVGDGTAVNNDVALIALRRNSAGQWPGQITGTINYVTGNYGFVRSAITGNILTAQVSALGYPGLLDAGDRMQKSDSATYLTTVAGALQMTQGSDFTGGASGGPWIVNFNTAQPVRSGGAVIGANSVMRVIGVTSWGAPGANAPKDNYASRLGQNPAFPNAAYGPYGAGNIGALMNALCKRIAPGTTQTFEQLGACQS